MPILSKIPDKIQEINIDNPKTGSYSLKWINVTNAGKKETDYLKKKFSFSVEHLRQSISTVFAQRPMVEDGKDYVFMILHFPVFKGDTIVAGEIEFFIAHGYLVTLHNGNLQPLNDFFDYVKKNPDTILSYETESSTILLYELLNRLIKDCYNILDRNSININEIEDIIFSGRQKNAVSKILELRRNIINIRKIMQNHKNILKHLQDMKSTLVSHESIKHHYEDLVEQSKRIWEILDNQKEMVEVFNDTNESLLNDKMNAIMKTLTIFSVLVLPLNLLAGIFGMNAKFMPFVDGRYGFWIIIGIMLVGLLALLSVFTKKKWL
jgi:magnesium transporter